ncbi:MAG: hypothetical protein U9M89_03120, partial [Patescibacteria group bacterium]|nr:hypothetical protein [Patescibacteria group bacterium]
YSDVTNTVTWDLGSVLAPDSGTLSLTVWVDDAFASSVEAVNQGTKKNGDPVAAERSIAENTLGAPQSAGLPGDTPGYPVNEWFFSLGFAMDGTTGNAASIDLAFDTPIFNGPGDDIKVYEVTYSGPYGDEMVKIEASNDMTIWEDLGTIARDGTVALPGSMQSAKYIRLTNMSDPALFEAGADGYDVDAVQALHPGICYIDNTAAISGLFFITSYNSVEISDEDTVGSVINEEVCIPELYIDKTGEYDLETNTITYYIDWQVTGMGTLYDVVVEDEVPVGTTYVDGSASDPDDAGPLAPGSEAAGVVSWLLGTQVAGSGGTLSFIVTVDSTEAWADYIVSENQGNRKDGTPVLANRSDSTKALGEAENNDTLNFYSLGFGEVIDTVQYGELVLGFDNYILNGSGADIEVVETSYGNPSDAAYPEAIELFVSQNGTSWISLGVGIQDEMFSFENGSTVLDWARYVKLVDRSDKSQFGGGSTTDGYDVDGVRAIYSAPEECSIDNLVEIRGETTGNELWQVFSPDVEAEANTTTEVNPIACDPTYFDVTTIITHKIICEDESELPNWGTGGPNIDASTAQDWVDSHDSCYFAPGWEFQWGPQNAFDPGDTLIGPAGSPWETSVPTDINGKTEITLTSDDIGGNVYLWFREVLKEGYIPFTHGPNDRTNVDDVSAELYCHIDVLNFDNYDRVDGISLGETYYCVGFNSPVPTPPEPGTITGMKFNDHDSDGEKDAGDEGLEGWTIYAAEQVDTVEVYAQNDDYDGEQVLSNVILENGQDYIIRASGTFTAGDSITADAQYSIRSGPEWTDLVENYGGYGEELLDLWIYSDYGLWGSFNPEHVYWHTMTGTGNVISLHIYDIYAFNNGGFLTVDIYKVLAEDVTDVNGDYSLDILAELEGDIVVAEETQEGWYQTSPMPLGLYVVPADGLTEGIDFGNHDITEEPGNQDDGDDGDNGDDGDDDGDGVDSQGESSGGGGGSGGAPGPSPEEGPAGGSGDDEGFGGDEGNDEPVGGGDTSGDEEVAGDSTEGSGEGTGETGNGTGQGGFVAGDDGQAEILGDTVAANDLAEDEEEAGGTSSGWRVFGIVFISLFLLLLVLYVIYRWLRSKGSTPTPGV